MMDIYDDWDVLSKVSNETASLPGKRLELSSKYFFCKNLEGRFTSEPVFTINRRFEN